MESGNEERRKYTHKNIILQTVSRPQKGTYKVIYKREKKIMETFCDKTVHESPKIYGKI